MKSDKNSNERKDATEYPKLMELVRSYRPESNGMVVLFTDYSTGTFKFAAVRKLVREIQDRLGL